MVARWFLFFADNSLCFCGLGGGFSWEFLPCGWSKDERVIFGGHGCLLEPADIEGGENSTLEHGSFAAISSFRLLSVLSHPGTCTNDVIP